MLNTETGVLHQLFSVLDGFPEGMIAISVYCIGSILVLFCWYFITKPYSKFCAVSSLVLFALLATPTVSEGSNAAIAPAILGLLFGILTKEHSLIWFNAASICFVIGLGLLCGFFLMKFSRSRT